MRLEVAKALHKIAEGVDDAGKMPVRICAAMLKDVELDVRRVALEQVHVVIEKFPADVEAAGIVAAVRARLRRRHPLTHSLTQAPDRAAPGRSLGGDPTALC